VTGLPTHNILQSCLVKICQSKPSSLNCEDAFLAILHVMSSWVGLFDQHWHIGVVFHLSTLA